MYFLQILRMLKLENHSAFGDFKNEKFSTVIIYFLRCFEYFIMRLNHNIDE